jgi:hypothetical protein
MWLRTVLLVAGLGALIDSSAALSQGRNAPLPNLDVPRGLEPYADVQLVLKNARRAIGLLGTAQLRLDPYPDLIVPAPGVQLRQRRIGPECDTAEVRSFNRGYLLAHIGFNLFLSLQELGVARVHGPHGMPYEQQRKFIQFGRSTLLSVWTPNRLRDLLEVRQTIRTLPRPIREDLSAFLSKLQEYRQHYVRLKKARPAILDELFKREDDAYYWYLVYLESKPRSEELLKKVPKGIGYSELSELLDEQLREVSDVAKTDPGTCFVEHYGPTIMFPSEKLEYDRTYIYPTKYMISFWRRRDMEGIVDLSVYVIARVLEALRTA